MEIISELSESLRNYLPWHKARLLCFTHMLMALLSVKTVNLVEWALAFNSKAKPDSAYRRIKRFFQQFEISAEQICKLIIHWFSLGNGDGWYFSMDRTNWQLGKCNINFLVLAVVYRNIAIPIYWKLLPKKGNSNLAERIEMMQWLLKYFEISKIKGLLADREFVGIKWFGYLRDNNIPFYIRVKANFIVESGKSQKNACFHFTLPQKNTVQILPHKVLLHGIEVFLSAMRLDSGDYLIVASSHDKNNAMEVYAKRWQIENLFQCLKGRGFRFEDTHLTHPERLHKLMCVLTLAFAWAYKIGYWKHHCERPIKLKKHGRPANSFFKYGLDSIRAAIFKSEGGCKKLIEHLKILFHWPPPRPENVKFGTLIT